MKINTTYLLALAVAISLACLALLTFTGHAQTDEVYYLDPGVNLAEGRGFRSTAWDQSPELVWSSSNPAMPLLYAGWFKIVGFGKIQSRILSIMLHFAGLIALTVWAQRRIPLSRNATLALLLFLVNLRVLAWACVSCRLEVFALLFFAWFLSIYFPKEGQESRLSPLLFGASTLLTGLHFVGYYAAACATIFLIQRSRQAFMRGLWVAMGMSIGALILWLGYNSVGGWDIFVQNRASHCDGREMPWVPTGWGMFAVSIDILCIGILSAITLVYTFVQPKRCYADLRLKAAIVLAVYLIVPAWMNSIGIFHVSYGWMIALPALLIFAKDLERLPVIPLRWTLPCAAFVIAAYFYSVGYRLHRDMLLCQDQQKAAAFVLSRSSKDDAIAATFECYYAFKPFHANLRLKPQSPQWPKQMYDELKWAVGRDWELKQKLIKGRDSEWEEVLRLTNNPNLNLKVAKNPDDYVVMRRK